MKQNESCPYCKGHNFIIAEQVGDGRVQSREVLTLESGHLYHVVCLHCGTVVRTFLEGPASLLTLGDDDLIEGEVEFTAGM